MTGVDCITRESAIDAIMGQPPDAHYPSWYAEQIRKLPAAEVKTVKRGFWWTYPDEDPDSIGNLLVWCSECDAEDHHVPGKKVPFCWHCGAEMSDEVKRLWEPPSCGADMREKLK